ncbi:HpcH/HpaI aldolase/citrate lyase family protein [Propioniciclava sinopodophylli]|uniref:HpcH/HpaI aldolase/citrate lyase family protein n=1 Tax=Propioniciclava sinopodophylli TaxID=1837344 RepID=UPI002492FFFF|nr:CoA ester lyase [Propioniciclava sinopodophylli]
MSRPSRPARVRRTVLTVPGSSDRFIAKARDLRVDALFLDLEDAVAPAVKEESRQRIVDALNDPSGFAAPTVTVRVNDWTTPWTFRDVAEVVGGAGARIDCLVLPKVTRADHVVALDLLLTQVEQDAGLPVGMIGVEAQVEDAVGLLHVAEIAAASPRLESLVFGPGDFMASLGMGGLNVGAQPAGYPADAFHHVLMSILVAARANGLQAIDGPFVAIRDVAGFEASAARAAALGYDGKWVLHPAQVEAGNAAFSPRVEDYERAHRIMDAYADATSARGGATGAIMVDDEMVDEAGFKLAAAIVARGQAAGVGAGREHR